jgi:hypothetical protein
MSTEQRLVTQEELFQANAIRRSELAKLPIEEKIAILVKMQQWESNIADHAGREHPQPWNLQKSASSDQ